jgi:hypothetical protein
MSIVLVTLNRRVSAVLSSLWGNCLPHGPVCLHRSVSADLATSDLRGNAEPNRFCEIGRLVWQKNEEWKKAR